MLRKVHFRESLSLLLIIALLIGISGVNGFAVDGEAFVGTSEFVEDDVEGVQEDTPFEDDISIQGRVIDEPEILNFQDSEGLMSVMGAPVDGVIEVGTAVELEAALRETKVNTIRLLDNIEYNEGISIIGYTITFDLGKYNLNVTNESGIALYVQAYGMVPGIVLLKHTTGEFNVTGNRGVYADNGEVTVTNATSTSNNYAVEVAEGGKITIEDDTIGIERGVCSNGGNITVNGDVIVTGTGTSTYGVNVISGNVIIHGDVRASGNGACGAFCNMGRLNIYGDVEGGRAGVIASGITTNPGECYIKGDVKATNGTGASITGDANITIEGIIDAKTYINIINQQKRIEDSINSDDKLGYKLYTFENNRRYTVWVKDSVGSFVAQINTIKYETLEAALAVVETGQNIRLLKSIDYNKGIEINAKKITFELNGYNLNVINASGTGLEVKYGGEVLLKGTGEFNVTGVGYGVYVESGNKFAETKATVTNATASSVENDKYFGAYAHSKGAEITILNDAKAVGDRGVGVKAHYGGKVIVGGDAEGNRSGAVAEGELGPSIVTVAGDVKSTSDNPESSGVYVQHDGQVTVGGNVLASGKDSIGARTIHDGSINITGNVEGGEYGAYADGGSITIGKNSIAIKEDYSVGAWALNGGSITIDGNIEGSYHGVFATRSSQATINGNAIATGNSSEGVRSVIDSKVFVKGDVIVSNGTGVYSDTNSEVTVDGKIQLSSGTYIIINLVEKTREGFDDTSSDPRYHQYSNDSSYVWVKIAEGIIDPPPVPIITTNLPITKSVTKGVTITFTISTTINDGGILSYQWYKDGVKIEGANADSLIISNASSSDIGKYKVIVTNTNGEGVSSTTESKECTLTVNTPSGNGGSGSNDDRPMDRDKEVEQPKQQINGVIVLDIDQDIIDENTLVPYLLNNEDESIVKFSAIFDGKMHLIGNSTTDYLLKDNRKHFTDISNYWAKDDINFVTAREFFDGTGNDKFSPDSPMTRAMAVTALGKLWGADISGFRTSRFIDVESGRNYTPYIEWAADNEIVKGIGNNSFAPDRAITREELAVIIDKFVDFTELILTEVDTNLLAFKDYLLISQWAIDSVKTIQKSETILGKPGNLFAPKDITTRGEFTAVLKRLIKNIVK